MAILRGSVKFGNEMLMGLSPIWDFVPFGIFGANYAFFDPKVAPRIASITSAAALSALRNS